MSVNYEKLEKEVRTLTPNQKASLARMLIDDLDSVKDDNVEELWIKESERRLETYRQGKLDAKPGEEVMERIRQHLE